jgi:hypothetical protein
MRRRIWLATLGALVLASSSALGQPSTGSKAANKAAADALFRQGREAFDKGDYARACPKFAESQTVDPAPGTLLNLALCEERMGKLVSARKHLEELVPQLPARDDRLPFAKDRLAAIDKRVGRLTLTLAPGAPPETEVKDERDGTTLPFGAEVPLDPGDYDLSITAPGRPPDRLRITLAEGQREARTITPKPAPEEVKPEKPSSAPPPPPPEEGRKLRRTLGFVAGGVGVASLGVAAITGGVLLSKKSAVDAECPHKRCSPKGLELKRQAERTPVLPLNTASWILGIAGVSAGAVLILTSGAKGTGEPKATAFATVQPFGGALGVRGWF